MATDVLPALTARVRSAAHPAAAPCVCAEPGAVLADRADGTVVRHGDVVAKAHAPGTDAAQLALRMAAADHPALDGVLLAPLHPDAAALHDRLVTLWPHGSPLAPDTDPERAPWEDAAALLARLHRVDTSRLPFPLPLMRGPVKAARALARLRAAGPHPGAAPVLRAWAVLPAWARDEAPMPSPWRLCHGDLHLGQLVRSPAGTGPWRLIDVDDLGLGAAAWDLARPAAWFAAGVVGPAEWARFLAAYRAAGGPAVPAGGDPWPALDVPARALSVQIAALAIAKASAACRGLDEVEEAMIDACARMAEVPVVAQEPVRPTGAMTRAVPKEGETGAAK
ncbi:aminoglycoside phosphotransferase [Streptomyces sulfonofaciens]|uniref:Aminoglycoside phosphotransferase n=1 Tax=Streptomyces sulfonofaciens TaxID=68272 RepID=A0A919FZZ3_9ACTN|nr:aminoglycoside phosphotransferase family protein [Streptomyces sulfonofaciens]GHH75637.1 aminoglycoside phosphotransferase [Streptomyces sulfonofaciens]